MATTRSDRLDLAAVKTIISVSGLSGPDALKVWDSLQGFVGHLMNEAAEPHINALKRVEALCVEWDTITKRETMTTRRIREAVSGNRDNQHA